MRQTQDSPQTERRSYPTKLFNLDAHCRYDGVILVSSSTILQHELARDSNRRIQVCTKDMLSRSTWIEWLPVFRQFTKGAIIIGLPNPATPGGSRRDKEAAKRLYTLTSCRESSTALLVYGPRSSYAWNLAGVQKLISEESLKPSLHKWCGLGCLESSKKVPLARTYLIYSNVPIKDTPCCGSTVTHQICQANDKETDPSDAVSQGQVNEKLWAQAVIQFLGYPLEPCLARATGADLTQSSFPSEPDQTLSSAQPVFPTESRIKQKEAKKKGQTSNPRRKWHEKHFDDCGDDQTGLDFFENHLCDEDLFAASEEEELEEESRFGYSRRS